MANRTWRRFLTRLHKGISPRISRRFKSHHTRSRLAFVELLEDRTLLSISFEPAVNYNTGSGPYFTAVGDFNGDSKDDLAVGNHNSGNVSVLLGNGNGTFPAAVNYGAGPVAFSVAVGDFNGDSKADLAVGNEGSNNVSILLGSGNGTFTASVNLGAGENPWSVVVGEFNGDSKLDLAVANPSSSNVSVLLGNGNGTFQTAVNYIIPGSSPRSVVLGDFNADGKTDLAIANAVGNAGILSGNGDGTFQTAVTYDAGSHPISVAAGDFNTDGKTDLAVANLAGNNVSILLGNGNGTFQSATNYAAGTSPLSVAAGDFDADGKVDLAVANSGSNNVSVLPGNGNGTFQAAVNFGVGTAPHSVTVGDFNADGKIDLVVANDASNNVSILLNNRPTGPGSQTIGFGTINNKTFGDADFTVSASTSSGLPVTFTATGNATVAGNLVHLTGPGSATITAHQAGNANFSAATDVSQSFTIAPPATRFFRAYNPNADYHFFTTSEAEFDNAVAHGYQDERTGQAGFNIPTTQSGNVATVYRLYNLQTGRHYYTFNAAERDFLVSLVPAPSTGPDTRTTGWRYEKNEGFIHTTQVAGSSEIFRLYNNNSGVHLYTENAAYKDAVLSQFQGIWVQHSSLGFAYPKAATPAPAAPTVDEAIGTTINPRPTFAWNTVAGVDHYDVWIDDVTANQWPVMRNSNVTESSWLASLSLNPGDIYRWRVRAVTNGNLGYWTAPRNFAVVAAPPLSLITVSGADFDPSLETRVIFTDPTGSQQSVFPSKVTSTLVEVAVPPSEDPVTFQFKPETYTVSVVQQSPQGPVNSGLLMVLRVTGFSAITGVPPGKVTTDYLQQTIERIDTVISNYRDISTVSGGTVDVSVLVNGLLAEKEDLVSTRQLLQPLVDGTVQQINLGPLDGREIILVRGSSGTLPAIAEAQSSTEPIVYSQYDLDAAVLALNVAAPPNTTTTDPSLIKFIPPDVVSSVWGTEYDMRLALLHERQRRLTEADQFLSLFVGIPSGPPGPDDIPENVVKSVWGSREKMLSELEFERDFYRFQVESLVEMRDNTLQNNIENIIEDANRSFSQASSLLQQKVFSPAFHLTTSIATRAYTELMRKLWNTFQDTLLDLEAKRTLVEEFIDKLDHSEWPLIVASALDKVGLWAYQAGRDHVPILTEILKAQQGVEGLSNVVQNFPPSTKNWIQTKFNQIAGSIQDMSRRDAVMKVSTTAIVFPPAVQDGPDPKPISFTVSNTGPFDSRLQFGISYYYGGRTALLSDIPDFLAGGSKAELSIGVATFGLAAGTSKQETYTVFNKYDNSSVTIIVSYSVEAPPFTGRYKGSFSGVGTIPGFEGPVQHSGAVDFTVSADYVINVSDPGGTGVLHSDGKTEFGGAGGGGVVGDATYEFRGQFTQSPNGTVSAGGTWTATTADGGRFAGSWSAGRLAAAPATSAPATLMKSQMLDIPVSSPHKKSVDDFWETLTADDLVALEL